MVNLSRGSRLGASSLGCLFSLALFVAALYYGLNIGQVYLRYYQVLDGMRSQARLAPSLSDEVIYRRLNGQADSLFAGGNKPHFKITRTHGPRRIIIETEYTDQVDLPLLRRTFVLRPRAEEPL
ncbi:MAG TPA: hypothetical protein VJ808_06295 [Gemmatimonadales bacterium]|jgi:hypothetical protein|nr:hypothetical protein [Gemmatimonadales bacterium]